MPWEGADRVALSKLGELIVNLVEEQTRMRQEVFESKIELIQARQTLVAIEKTLRSMEAKQRPL